MTIKLILAFVVLLPLMGALASGNENERKKLVQLTFSKCGEEAFFSKELDAPESSIFSHNNFESRTLQFEFEVEPNDKFIVNHSLSDVRDPYARIAMRIMKQQYKFGPSRCVQSKIHFFPE